jgi:hypothetical protein
MSKQHLTMEQLVAVRDGDRSEPDFAVAHQHVEACRHCKAELERLHQRTARLRALNELAPASDQYPAIRTRLVFDQRKRRNRRFAFSTVAAAAALALAVMARDLVTPPDLEASSQLRSAMDRNTFLEETLDAWNPEGRVANTRTIVVVLELEDRIAEVDARLEHAAQLRRQQRLANQVELWQERVSLMTALVDVHLTRTANVDL